MTIVHVDMDAFYASVEQRDHPELRGRPVIVGGIEGRGVVSAASYEARAFGVHSAMPIAIARSLCPQGVFLPVRMQHYAQIARQIRALLLAITPYVEPLSLDEAFLDVRGSQGLHGPAPEIARHLKATIKRETGLIASVGVAPNKFLAKLASDIGKPDGLVILASDQVDSFLAPLPVSRLWGVGPKTEQRLHTLSLRTIGQLAAQPERLLVEHFGKLGRHLWQLAHGQDERTVVPDREAKSISTETTFARDIAERDVLRRWLLELTDQLAGRLRQAGLWARTVEIKIRSAAFRTRHRGAALSQASQRTDVLWQAAQELLDRGLTSDWLPVRLLGVGACRLTRGSLVQLELFDEQRQEQLALDQIIDDIRGQFGDESIRRGSSLDGLSPEAQPGTPESSA
jgi:DNA polymerase-4